jgi:Xaa-Pro aminopeptidase
MILAPIAEIGSEQQVVQDAAGKRQRVRQWLDKRRLDGVILSRADNFAWITAGGCNKVVKDADAGVGHIVITPDRQYLVAYYMDAQRLWEEQAPSQGYELVTKFWHEGDERRFAKELAGQRVGADTPFPGTENVNQQIVELQWPLTVLDLERTRWLGKQHSDVLEKLFRQVEPGLTEKEIGRRLEIEFIRRGVKLDVSIIGSDERITKFRHLLATDKKLERYLILGPVISRWGLHSLCSRSLHFGEPPVEIARAYQAAATIEGRIFAELKEGLKFSAILELQKKWYAELGYPDDWNYHFQGGPTGYVTVDVNQNQTENVIHAPQPYSWFTTIRGAKVEELSILTKTGVEIASFGKDWPAISVETEKGPYVVPGMLVR